MKNRLILLTLATSSLVLVAFMIPLALMVRSAAAEHAVDDAATQAQATASLVATLDRTDLPAVVGQSVRPVTVFLPDGGVVGQQAVRDDAIRLAATGRSLTTAAPGGREVLVAVAGLPDGTAVVRTFVPDSELRRGVARTWMILGAVALGLLAVTAAVAAMLARSLIRPLTALVDASDAMASGDLTVRTAEAGPQEVRRVGSALNRLAERISALLQHERETVADLSHRLRTPLTALRIDAESLRDPEDHARIGEGLDDLERVITDIIRTARRPSAGEPPGAARADAAAVVRDRTTFWSALAEEQDRLMHVDLPPQPVWVAATPEDVSECVDTLLDNVFTHTDEGTPFTVRLIAATDGGATLTIADSGPGFPDPSAVVRGTSTRLRSTGLGLDIATRVATRSGGTLTVTASTSGGAAVVVEFGPPRGDAGAGRRALRTGRRASVR
ncbi:HAMP domain-containing sensor histidine kinase [Catenulispora subtropica]|uniref:histidine kinase n=1 Tax=Catenulispora subtropica TaxID=450798 RepID=A0ABP5E1T8_9ACTN